MKLMWLIKDGIYTLGLGYRYTIYGLVITSNFLDDKWLEITPTELDHMIEQVQGIKLGVQVISIILKQYSFLL